MFNVYKSTYILILPAGPRKRRFGPGNAWCPEKAGPSGKVKFCQKKNAILNLEFQNGFNISTSNLIY